MKIKVSDATNTQLDWLVEWSQSLTDLLAGKGAKATYSPTTDWSQGGLIIESEHIHTSPHTYGPATVILNSWHAVIGFDPDGGEHLYEAEGPTPLIAAMRCYVSSKLGDEVEVPDNLE